MGWIAGKAIDLGRGLVKSPRRVVEPAGYEGEMVTVYETKSRGLPLRFTRKGRTVYATKREAMENS
jgi:hypothetical protein